jgi:hypothetical protein
MPSFQQRLEVKRILVMLWAVLIATGAPNCVAQTRRDWPHVREFDRKYSFEKQEDMFLQFPVSALDWKTAYIVECGNPFAKDPRMRNFEWSGDFECRVARPGIGYLPDAQLLIWSAQGTVEWESRGRFWWNELTPNCINFPDWGGTRVYRFRYMRITIRITNPKIDPYLSTLNTLQGLDVEISGRYDERANRSVAGLTRISEPPPIDSKDGSPRQCGIPQK